MTSNGSRKPVLCTLAGVLLAASALLAPAAVAEPDSTAPQAGSPCTADLVDAMTVLPDDTTYVVCGQAGADYAWAPVQLPFPPNDQWLSYGPPIALHGQGMRNPNLSSGRWTATPRDPQTRCRVTQTTVVQAGVLAAPETNEGEQGAPLTVDMKPQLFYVELGGNCLWRKD